MKSLVSVALILSLTVPGFAQSTPPPCTPAPGQSVCSSPGAKNIWNGTSTYMLLIGVPVGIAGGLIVRHHYHHKAQEELARMQQLQKSQPAIGPNTMNSTVAARQGEFWGFSGADWAESGFTGVQVVRVSTGSAAEAAGLNVGNVVMTVNGRSVGSTQEMAATMAQIEPGSTVKISYLLRTHLGWMPKETILSKPK